MQEKRKTIMVILDGFDYSYIEKNIDKFDFFKTLFEAQCLCPLESVVPADSIPSWTTIYTGLNPAEHGVLESIDYLAFKNQEHGDYSVIQGNTFFDVLSRQGKRVFVFNPFMAYPAWDVNGLMICGPVFEGGEVSSNHPNQVDFKNLPDIGGMVEQPTNKQMVDFYNNTMKLSQKQFDAFHKYFKKDIYDFAFCGITTPDRMQHFLWRYNDPDDRTHPKDNPLMGSILKMYQLMEKNVQKIMNDYGDEYNVVIISDHGHGRRCEKTFYINQWLISQGIIHDKSKKKRAIEYAKNTMFRILDAFDIVEPGTKFFKQFKFAHKVKNAEYVFDDKKKKVYAPKFDGTNPFGGIMVTRSEFASEEEYEAMRQQIIDGLLKVTDGGEPIMLWVKRREDIYEGAKVANYPDIVYRMKPQYGVDRGLYGKRLFGINAMHSILSGGHQFIGVIMGNRVDVKEVNSVLNIHDYIISISGV
ncbi:alkaline phosphatase family protein [Negativibacillus massiliensis]|uniref:alkaline phosphatase family protein n=1 Tax=Negativibacillus massiliensis TaxID=1871035 RepID=UPI003AF2C405